MGYMSKVYYEVDLRERETGNSVETIYSGTDDEKAYGIAEDWNIEHGYGELQVDYESFDDLRFHNNPNTNLFADVYHVEDSSELHDLGKHQMK